MKKLLIGGQALRTFGSSRHTNDHDYLVFDENSKNPFVHADDVDYINANGNEFFRKIWEMEKDNNGDIASPQAVLELKCYAFVQHCQNFNFQKADDCEFDIKFLVRKFNIEPKIVQNFCKLEFAEIEKVVKSVKK